MNTPLKVAVRMYNVGFGDSFLVSVQQGGRPWRMLVDCGVHNQGGSGHDLDAVVDDIAGIASNGDGQPRLDIVVATHRHRDHILGFENPRWQNVEVGEVWLPWIEDPSDAQAVMLRARHDAAALALHHTFAAAGDEDSSGLALNSLTNERAMWTLRNGFAGSPARRYISAGGAAPAEVPGLPGGRVFFLGPSRLPEAISALEPPKSQRWFQVTGTQPEHGKGLPFRPVFAIEPETFRARHPHLMLPTELVEQLASEEPDALTAVTWLDRAINNTSVMFLLEVGDIRLLFPGDAQWGAWQPLLDDPGVRALLSVVTVYKVSHHGSHNGTPVGLVEDILPMNLMSLLSVRPIPRWANVPKSELVAALRKPGRRLLTSSGGNHEASTIEGPDGLWVEVRMPTR